MSKIISIFLLGLMVSCKTWKGNPVDKFYRKEGYEWRISKIYCFPNGKKTLAEIDTWRNGWLWETKIYYQYWTSEWRFISKEGFTTVKNGFYLLNSDSVIAPDNFVLQRTDKNMNEEAYVFKGGKKFKIDNWKPDGVVETRFGGDNPGVYRWENGRANFVRRLSDEDSISSEVFKENAIKILRQKDSLRKN
jgi:hypothetical protein